MFLPDVNVWVALTIDSHVHHPSAKAWWDKISDPIFFNRSTQMGLFRLTTDKKIFSSDALNMSEAWQKYDTYQTDPRVSFVDEPIGVVPQWRLFTSSQLYSPKLWNDAYLAAFAICAGLELVTFDQGFTQFPNLKYTILT